MDWMNIQVNLHCTFWNTIRLSVCYWQDDTPRCWLLAVRFLSQHHSLNTLRIRSTVLNIGLGYSIHQFISSTYENMRNSLKLVYPMSPLGLDSSPRLVPFLV